MNSAFSGNEMLTGLLIFIGVMALTSLIFGGWVVISVLKGIGNILFGASNANRKRQGIAAQQPHVAAAPLRQTPAPFIAPLPPTQQTLGALLNVKGINPGVSGGIPCQGHGCRQLNPPSARFCRRCGHPISQATAAAQRRVAMW